MKNEKTEISDVALIEAGELLTRLVNDWQIDSLNLSPRDKEIFQMRWHYGLSLKQIAEKIKLSDTRTQQIYGKIINRIMMRITRGLDNNPDIEVLKKENEKLKGENKLYKQKFEALNKEEKEQFLELDIVVKKIRDVGLSKKTCRALAYTNIVTVADLLQYRLSSLLMFKGVTIEMVREIEKFTWDKHLKMKM